MAEEVVFAVDSNDNPIAGLKRSEVIRKTLWRRTSGGIVVDPDQRLILVHKRSPNKDERPNLWVCTFGGKVQENEKSDEAAKRELYEEFGITTDSIYIWFLKKWKSEPRKQFEYLFYIFIDAKNTHFTSDPKEVEQHEWITFEAALSNLNSNPGWYNYGYEKGMITSAKNTWEAVKNDPSNKCQISCVNYLKQ